MCSGCTERLVTAAQIAAHLGVSRGEAEALAARPGFPAAVGDVRSSSPPFRSVPLWRLAEIRRWAAAR